MAVDDAAVEHYLALSPHEFGLVDRLELRRLPADSEWGPGVSMEMELLDGDLDAMVSGDKLWLKFYRIEGLTLDVGGILKVSRLEVHSIRERGWQDLKYVVEDTESMHIFKFCCAWFEAERRPRRETE